MKRRIILLLLIGVGWHVVPAPAQEDFLTSQEISSLRDTQEPDKRILLYLEFAQRRLDAVKEGLASKKSDAGRTAQKHLKEYYSVLEALEVTMEDAREKRVVADKALKEVERQGGEFLKYLQSLESSGAPGLEDYRYTLEEAVAMTQDELAEAKKGSFPEVKEREPPRQLPATPPPASSGKGEEGPPRKKRPAR